MAKINYIQADEDDILKSYFITLSDVYYFNVSEDNSEKEQLQTESTIENISSLIFHAITIEGTTIREMDNEVYERIYKRFYNDIMNAIKECAKNGVIFEDFLVIIDEIIGAAITLASAFGKIEQVKAVNEEVEVAEEDSDEQLDEDEKLL
ncbi:hypothetical protein [Neobacillus sp. D3-1R]|uniref:hypothetical protein n=1 Tax=Neobacillus sp. D3-1R TaxID=3445778 RepID=UPI003F9EBC11